jgi:hypothetical protein
MRSAGPRAGAEEVPATQKLRGGQHLIPMQRMVDGHRGDDVGRMCFAHRAQ